MDLSQYKTYIHKGYIAVYIPDHPMAWKGSGLVYAHRLIMEEKLGRPIFPSEHVHHKNENPKDNRIENLEIVSASQHAKIHHEFIKPAPCEHCGDMFKPYARRLRFCSVACYSSHRVINNKPSKDDLVILLGKEPVSKISKSIGVSDQTIKNWCKKYGIDVKTTSIFSHTYKRGLAQK